MFPSDRETDRHDAANSRSLQFCRCARKVTKTSCCRCLLYLGFISLCCWRSYHYKLQQHCMSFVVASAGVCLALKAATPAVGIPPAWHATTTFCVLCCWASRSSACASQLCWQLLSSSSASARSGKRLSLSQSNTSSMLHVV